MIDRYRFARNIIARPAEFIALLERSLAADALQVIYDTFVLNAHEPIDAAEQLIFVESILRGINEESLADAIQARRESLAQ